MDEKGKAYAGISLPCCEQPIGPLFFLHGYNFGQAKAFFMNFAAFGREESNCA